jgi:hypothetical protein
MTTRSNARVLIVDDRPDGDADSIAAGLRGRGLTVTVDHPADVRPSQLRSVDLLLVDYELTQWDQSNLAVANTCSTGWSLAAVLRDAARLIDRRSTAAATAILTSRIDSATVPFTSAGREHITAELNGIEWVFDKSDEALGSKILELAKACKAVRRDWSRQDIFNALGVKAGDSSRESDVLRCRPPLAESLRWQDGLGFIRWMIQKILPYPTFLIDEYQLGARLGLSVNDVRALVSGNSKLAKELARERYIGVLSQFLGNRWWRVGVDAVLWRITSGRPTDVKRLQAVASGVLGGVCEPLPEGAFNLVVCLDEGLLPLPRPVDVSLAVRIWPDDWPPYATQAWASAEQVEESERLKQIAAAPEAGR